MPYPPPDKNKNCRCYPSMIKAHLFCSEGHMTECHAGLDCASAVCGHLERYLHDDPETRLTLINDPLYIASQRITWFSESKGTNEPDCLCSICLKPIEPSETDIPAKGKPAKRLPALRLVNDQLNLKCRFHKGECLEAIRPLIEEMIERGMITEDEMIKYEEAK